MLNELFTPQSDFLVISPNVEMQIDRQVLSASFKQVALTGKHIQDGSHCQEKTRTLRQMRCSYQKLELSGS